MDWVYAGAFRCIRGNAPAETPFRELTEWLNGAFFL
jgi:hypothetical protein